MAHVQTHSTDLDLSSPYLLEGLPGIGLVGKIAVDHIVEQFDMTNFAAIRCEGLPEVAVYDADQHEVTPPVRVYADEERDLLALQSDVPVSPNVATEFASCVTDWFDENDVTPIYCSGLAEEKDGVPEMYGIGTGDGPRILREHDVRAPPERGMISGPTGALIAAARQADRESVGLIVQANAQFPDPEGARILLTEGIGPIAEISVDTDPLTEQAQEIAAAKQKLAQRMQQADDESTRAQPVGMFQ